MSMLSYRAGRPGTSARTGPELEVHFPRAAEGNPQPGQGHRDRPDAWDALLRAQECGLGWAWWPRTDLLLAWGRGHAGREEPVSRSWVLLP